MTLINLIEAELSYVKEGISKTLFLEQLKISKYKLIDMCYLFQYKYPSLASMFTNSNDFSLKDKANLASFIGFYSGFLAIYTHQNTVQIYENYPPIINELSALSLPIFCFGTIFSTIYANKHYKNHEKELVKQ